MLCKRSYEKERDLPLKKNFVCRKLYGYNFNRYPNIKTSIDATILDLGKNGKKIISKYMKDNEKNEKMFKEKEDFLYKFYHSKPPLECNTWKFSNHIIKEFSRPPCDKIHSFAKEIKPNPKYMTKPFRRPKENGDYFDKNLF